MALEQELHRQLGRLGIAVTDEMVDRLLRLQGELLRWNRTHNLTAITDPQEALEKHLVDSLTLLQCLPMEGRLLDLGSGGGFPCLPVKITRPGIAVVSVDAVAKKIAFQRHAGRKLGLKGFEPLHIRAEELAAEPGYRAGFDLVVSRAFTSLRGFVELALPYLKPGGLIVAMKGPEGEKELLEDKTWLQQHGVTCERQIRFELPASGAVRVLLEMRYQHKM